MAAAFDLTGPQILIIDDDFFVRDFAVHTIEFGTNRKVAAFENGLNAWQYIQKRHYRIDVIITDANIPEINGIELLGRIKNNYPTKSVIITSSNPAHENTARQMGADAFLSKPFEVSDIFTLIEQFVFCPTAGRG